MSASSSTTSSSLPPSSSVDFFSISVARPRLTASTYRAAQCPLDAGVTNPTPQPWPHRCRGWSRRLLALRTPAEALQTARRIGALRHDAGRLVENGVADGNGWSNDADQLIDRKVPRPHRQQNTNRAKFHPALTDVTARRSLLVSAFQVIAWLAFWSRRRTGTCSLDNRSSQAVGQSLRETSGLSCIVAFAA